MNYKQFLTVLQNCAATQNYVNSVNVGEDVYHTLNQPGVKYGNMTIGITDFYRNTNAAYDTYNIIVYFADRLLQDDSNVNDVFAAANRALVGFAYALSAVEGVEVEGEYTVNYFKQSFADYCAGGYMNISVMVSLDINECDVEAYLTTPEDITITRNGCLQMNGNYNVTIDVPMTGVTGVTITQTTGSSTTEIMSQNAVTEELLNRYTKEEVDALVAEGLSVYTISDNDILSADDYNKLFDKKSIVLLKNNTNDYLMVYRKSDELWAIVDFGTDGNNSYLSLKLAKGTLQSDGTYLIGIREVKRNVDAYTKAKTDELVADAKECIFITRAQVLTDEELEKINSGKYLICLKNDDGDVIPLSQRSDGNMYGSYYSYHNYTWGLQQLITTTYRVCIEDNTVHLSNGDADIRFYNVKDSSKVLTASYTTDYINNNYGRKAVATVEEDGLILDTNGTYTYSGDTFSAITPDIAYTAHKFALEIDNFEPKLTLSNGSDACYNMHMVNYYINADRSKEWTTELVMIFEGYYKGKHINATLTIPKVWGDVDGWVLEYTVS